MSAVAPFTPDQLQTLIDQRGAFVIQSDATVVAYASANLGKPIKINLAAAKDNVRSAAEQTRCDATADAERRIKRAVGQVPRERGLRSEEARRNAGHQRLAARDNHRPSFIVGTQERRQALQHQRARMELPMKVRELRLRVSSS